MEKNDAAMVKMLIRGAVAEAGVEEQFTRDLQTFRDMYQARKEQGDKESGAFLLAVTYFGTEVQE